jgi:hypothetical protein
MISPDPAVRAGAVVDEAAARLFGIIESSYESVALLLQEVDETATDVGENLRRDTGADTRRREALGLVGYKLDQLRFHLTTSQRRLGDLRALGRFLDGESEMDRRRREEDERRARSWSGPGSAPAEAAAA